MKKKTSNLAAGAPEKGYTTLEERILRSDLSEQDKIEIIKIIGRQNSTGVATTITSPWSPEPNIVYCKCCCEE